MVLNLRRLYLIIGKVFRENMYWLEKKKEFYLVNKIIYKELIIREELMVLDSLIYRSFKFIFYVY